MKRNKLLTDILFTLLCISPVIYLLAIWGDVPDMIPIRTQYNFKDEGVGLRDKTDLWGPIIIASVISAVVYWLTRNINKIDPKRTEKPQVPVFNKIAIGLPLLLTALTYIMLFDSIGRLHNAKQIALPMVGILFAFLGNIMPNIKPNYFIGLRLPWALSSDYNWKKTHQLAGKLWFGGGLLFAISYLIAPKMWNDTIFLILIVLLVAIPSIYSFVLFKQHKTNLNRQ